ncbi:MAG: NADPH:quinone oxidoreductase family protein [Proteobacteria bacterium]|nr:NADPH:quinone oxidoreductase family protein [Pseudomonadota bacterium]HQR04971.1 NADPH:quinone oxidoreductase family protein [Rhodocyclaceae bacterium]
MKALLCHEFGPIDTLRLTEVPDPVPGPGEVIVSMKAAGLNFPDTLIVQGKYQLQPPLPFAPGIEFAGTVRALGAGVTGFTPGDRVFASVNWGALAEQVKVPANALIRLPANLDFTPAAVLKASYGTGYHGLVTRGGLKAGETLVVLGAAGGVGSAAVELGRLLGARVIACASSPEKLAFCRHLGADAVIDYSHEDLKERIKALTGGAGADVVYDPVGGDHAEPALRALAREGRYLVIGFAAGGIPRIPLNLALLKQISIIGVFLGGWEPHHREEFAADMQKLMEWCCSGRIQPAITRTLPLSRAVEGLQLLARRQATGKIVITC